MAKIILNSKSVSIDNIINVTENKEKIHSRIKASIKHKTIFIEVAEKKSFKSTTTTEVLININHISKIY